jgi:two-component system, NarL family, nitrate/nitrite response regulator NarL
MCLGKPHCLLIIDDSPYIRHAVHLLFDHLEGWQVCYEAADGIDGIEKAKLYHPCAIVLDMAMPVMDGLQTARELKKLVPSTPLFMFTNFAEDQFLQHEVREAGIQKVIAKEDAATLVAAVNAALPDSKLEKTA